MIGRMKRIGDKFADWLGTPKGQLSSFAFFLTVVGLFISRGQWWGIPVLLVGLLLTCLPWFALDWVISFVEARRRSSRQGNQQDQ